MKKLLLILLCIPIFFSCGNNKKTQDDSLNKIIGFSITSKNSQLTSKSGIEVSTNEMITKKIEYGNKVLFKNFNFTLENEIEGALNFYSENGILMCNAPTKLSVMSMPPNGSGLTTFNKGDRFEISKMSLIKIDSINFVISNIKINDE
tara:strand:+ start:820 stop:1263 length:444 start_codon:yes stop_codon:yes gene_type:complete